ncbi:hypothetical protein TNCV_1847141 [Trichonephila clavipes]|nr:hypothetical protein TNCV_1847141 [Trichonephila clavipes]
MFTIRTMHHSSTSDVATTYVLAQPTPMDEKLRMHSIKSGWLVMSPETTVIHAVRSFNVTIGVSYTNGFQWPQTKKSKGLRTKKHGCQETDHCV